MRSAIYPESGILLIKQPLFDVIPRYQQNTESSFSNTFLFIPFFRSVFSSESFLYPLYFYLVF